jgi:thiol-disulfide isomerase/thioredoxin
MKRLDSFAVVVVLLVGLAVSARADVPKGIILKGLTDERAEVDSLVVTGPVVINFWATWCRPCRIEMPHLQKVYAEMESLGVHFAAVSLDNPRSKDRLSSYVAKENIALPVYHDADGSLAKLFKVQAIPTTIVLDREGQIIYMTRGYRPGDEILLKKKLEELLKTQYSHGKTDKG